MTVTHLNHASDIDTLPRLPSWVTQARAEEAEDVAFFSGAALSHLHLILQHPNVPKALILQRLALRAAEACLVMAGRPERLGELRDGVYFLRNGDLPGPAGETGLAWLCAVERQVSVKSLERALPAMGQYQIATWLRQAEGAPITQAACVLEAVLTDDPRAEQTALIMADAVLARALGWDHLVPLFAIALKPADLRQRGAALRLACHRAVVAATIEAVLLAGDLTRRAGHLTSIAPKLRAKAAGAAVQMFLTRDAVAPTALPMPDRAARRLCDRLVDLGAVRELTGRETFRLYGV